MCSSLILFSGYVNKYGGHAILLYIEANEYIQTNENTEGNYNLYIFNSGQGIEYHENNAIGIKFNNINKDNISKIIKFTDIFNKSKRSRADILYILVELGELSENESHELNKSKNYYTYDLYKLELLDKINIHTFYKLIHKYLNTKYTIVLQDKPQLSGSCTFYSQFYFLKYYFETMNLNFSEFHTFLLNDIIDSLSNYKITENYNKNILTFLFAINKDYGSKINYETKEKIIHKISEIVNIETIIKNEDSKNENNNYVDEYLMIKTIVKNYYNNKNIINFSTRFIIILLNKNIKNKHFFLNTLGYIFYTIICDYFSEKNIISI